MELIRHIHRAITVRLCRPCVELFMLDRGCHFQDGASFAYYFQCPPVSNTTPTWRYVLDLYVNECQEARKLPGGQSV